ncbi:phosphatase [Betaproteobacteria bacterium]|nr:phosphatase [Betaproteobacteria bacterium]GHT98227.1 phosphatase [Betaproteobacteria bacterium]GHU12708.1 phosphatase [Betaproteobacteria bacterium]GHU21952.1 phosphatase [Betaproteobacteria bacterium]
MNADLHCHSAVSDGWLTPAEVVRRARANGAELLALTDHDEVGGVAEAAAEAAALGLGFVGGVEISVSWGDETLHVVGLGVDAENPALCAGLAQVRSGRLARAGQMAAALEQVGLRGVLEGARRFARNPDMIGRAHFARHLVASGVARDVHSVFDHYLSRGKPGFVAHQWATLAEAVGWIRGAGGVAVVAHPARYHRMSATELDKFFNAFIAEGGEGVEVVAGAHTTDEMLRFASLARRKGLLASRGSDFHGPDESVVDVGRCNPLPPDLAPVWSRWNKLLMGVE